MWQKEEQNAQPYAPVYVIMLEAEAKFKIFDECAANGKKGFFRIVNPDLDRTFKPWNKLDNSTKVHDIRTVNAIKFFLR